MREKQLFFNFNGEVFRLAEGHCLKQDYWSKYLKTLMKRTEKLTDKCYNFHRRAEAVVETVHSFTIGLRENGAKCGFARNECTNGLADQFILGLIGNQTQTQFLQKPPGTLHEALVVARMFKAAQSMMQTLRQRHKYRKIHGGGCLC